MSQNHCNAYYTFDVNMDDNIKLYHESCQRQPIAHCLQDHILFVQLVLIRIIIISIILRATILLRCVDDASDPNLDILWQV